MFRILQYGDLHLEKGNLDLSVPPLHRIAEIAEEMKPDLAVFTGDAVTKRAAFHPEAALEFRVASERIARVSRYGLIGVDGNHDVSFDGTASFVAGALADSLERVGSDKIRIASGRPRVYDLASGVLGADAPVVVAIPTFDRYTIKAAELEGEGTPEGIAAAIVRGLIAEATEAAQGRPIVVVYHGSLAGAKLGNEQIIRSNIDIPLDPAAFAGVRVVLLGHIHRPQTLDLGGRNGVMRPAIYNGATCPLSWGEKEIEPGVVEVTFGPDPEGLVGYKRHPLPVVSQMIERTIRVDAEMGERLELGETLADVIVTEAGLADIPENARVRIKVEGRGALLDLIDGGTEDMIADRFNLRDLSFVVDRTPERLTSDSLDRRVSIVDAVAHWYGEQPESVEDEDGTTLAALVALATEIESEVRDEDLDARYDFRPISLSVRNFCQFSRAYLGFDELGGVSMIRGVNTAGKSNLARAVPFLLYKKQLSGDVMGDLIRNGESKAEGTLTFASGGDVYRIRRVLKRGKDRSASSVLFFERVVDPDSSGELARFEPAVEGTEQETQQKINELVGPAELFFASAFADQGSIAGLLNLRPAEMKDLLASVLHRDFTARVEKCRLRRREEEGNRGQGRTILAEHDRELAKISEAAPALALESVNEARTAKAREKEEISNDDELNAQVEELVGTIARIEGEQEARAEKVAEAERLTEALEAIRPKVAAAEGAKGKLDELRAKVDQVVRIQEDGEKLETEAKEARRKATEDVEPEIKLLEDVIREKVAGRDQAKREADRAVVESESALQRRRKKLEAAQTAAGAVAEIPCGGREFFPLMEASDDPEDYTADGGTCPSIIHTKQVADELDGHRDAVTELERELEEVTADAETAGQEITKEIGPLEEKLESIKSTLFDLAVVAHTADDGAAEKRQAVAALGAPGTELALAEAAAESLDELTAEKTRLLQEADRIAAELMAGSEIGAELGGKKSELGTKRQELAGRAARRAVLEEELLELTGKASRLETMLERLDELTQARDGLSEAVAASEVRIAIFNLYETALGRDGVPFLLLELYAIPELQDRANAYLEPTDWRLEVASERASVSSGLKPGVYVAFSDWRGKHPVSAASGAQEVAIGSALRQAISDLHAGATGTTIRFSVQDEGFGAYDPENLKGAMATIQEIARARETFLFISHIEGMEAIADHLIEVMPSPEGSEITIDGEANG